MNFIHFIHFIQFIQFIQFQFVVRRLRTTHGNRDNLENPMIYVKDYHNCQVVPVPVRGAKPSHHNLPHERNSLKFVRYPSHFSSLRLLPLIFSSLLFFLFSSPLFFSSSSLLFSSPLFSPKQILWNFIEFRSCGKLWCEAFAPQIGAPSKSI